MASLKRAFGAVGGALKEYGDMELKARIEERHARRMAEVKNKYATDARTANEKFQLQRDTQAQKERFRIAEYETGERAKAAETKYERGLTATDKQHAHEIQKAKIGATGKGESDVSRRMGDAKVLFREMLKVDPEGDKQAMFFKAYALANESKRMSPEEDINSMYRATYTAAVKEDIPEKEARKMAQEAKTSYQKDVYPDFSADRKRSDEFKRNGKALADQNGGDETAVRNGEALGVISEPGTVQEERRRQFKRVQ